MCYNGTVTMSDLWLVPDSTKYTQSESRKMDIKVAKSGVCLTDGQWNSAF